MNLASIESEVSEWIESIETANGCSHLVDQNVQIRTSLGSRKSNQDRAVFVQIGAQRYACTPISCAIIADGMGGMTDGGLAASIAVGSFIAFISAGQTSGGLKSLLTSAVMYANDKVYDRFRGNGGTTFSAVLFGQQGLVGINVGDSRIYSVSTNSIERLTVDDSFAEQLRHHFPERHPPPPANRDNRLLQFVGMGKAVQPHIVDLDSDSSETMLLLTSDGAHYLGDKTLVELTNAGLPASRLPEAVIEISRMCGSDDNASVILAPRRPAFSDRGPIPGFARISIAGSSLTIPTSDEKPKPRHLVNQFKDREEVDQRKTSVIVSQMPAVQRIKRSPKLKPKSDLPPQTDISEAQISSLGFVDEVPLPGWKDGKN